MGVDHSRLLADAEQAARRGDMQKAAACYRALVDARPDDRVLLQRLGDALARSGEAEEACEVLARLADLYRAEGDQHRSVALLRRACRLADDRNLLDKLGCWLCEQGLSADARQPLLDAARLHEAAGDAAAALAVWRRLAEGPAGGLEALRQILRLGAPDGSHPLSPRERATLALGLSRQGALEESIENFAAAAEAGTAMLDGGGLEHFARAFQRLGEVPRPPRQADSAAMANWTLLRAAVFECLDRRDEARRELLEAPAADWPAPARLAVARRLTALEAYDAAAGLLLDLGTSPAGVSEHALRDALSELVMRDPGQHAVMERLLAVSPPPAGEKVPDDDEVSPSAEATDPPGLSPVLRAQVLEVESFIAHGMYSRAQAALARLAGAAGPHPEVSRLEQELAALRPPPPKVAPPPAEEPPPPPLAMGPGEDSGGSDDEEWVIDFDEATGPVAARPTPAPEPGPPAAGGASRPGDLEGLDACLEEALPEEDLETRYQMAVGLWEMELREQALALFAEIARTRGSRAVDSALMAVRAWTDQGELERALGLAAEVLEAGLPGDGPGDSEAELRARAALLAHAVGRCEKATAWLGELERLHPDSPMLGTVRERLGSSKT
ncbi:MAG: hypothetical protein Q9Q40_06305 [Acidobacteriota bacterium]|nr:hypothetical protein [Acidobacteriota bacterium]MDQ7086811.1 hypothetical protein [Acidobacteriota bacterium]